MRRAILFGTAGLAGALLLVWAVLRQRDGKRDDPRQTKPVPQSTTGSVDLSKLARALPSGSAAVRPDDVRALVREAAEARRTREEQRFLTAFRRITTHGAAIQKLLAEILLEVADADERLVAAMALKEVATAEIGPFALGLVRSDLPENIQEIAVELLAKFRVKEAAPLFEAMLFQAGTGAGMKEQMIAYFAEVGGAEVLARAATDTSMGELRETAAKGLAKIGTEQAARLLFEGWKKTFVPGVGEATANYFMLQALATFQPNLLRGLVKEFLANESDESARNVFLSMLSKADRALAMETIKDVLATEKSVSVRQQAIFVLGEMGGVESQQMLLDILASTASPQEGLDSANALLHQDRMLVPFEKVKGFFGGAKDPVVRAILAEVLAKYEAVLKNDPALVAELRREADDGIGSKNPAIRGLSLNLSARLAQYGADPATNLISLYESMPEKERTSYPVVFQELSKKNDDPRVRTILETTLANESASEPNRVMAADALFASGGEEQVYGAIRNSKDAGLTALLTHIALARGGEKAATRLEPLAAATKDADKKQAISDQLKAWAGQK